MTNNLRQTFALNFAKRLTNLLNEKGFSSTRSVSGVNYNPLAKVIGCSKQMTRRYTLGEALPSYDIVLKMSEWLEVSPGWLLFGDNPQLKVPEGQAERVGIDYELLRYILSESALLFATAKSSQEVVDFVIDVIYDATHINESREVTMKVIDLAVTSAKRFNKMTNKTEKQDVKHTYG